MHLLFLLAVALLAAWAVEFVVAGVVLTVVVLTGRRAERTGQS